MNRSSARFSSSTGERERLRGGVRSPEAGLAEEPLGGGDQQIDAAEQAIGCLRVLHPPPAPLDGVVLVDGVLRQPQQAEVGMLGSDKPRPNSATPKRASSPTVQQPWTRPLLRGLLLA